MKKQKICLFKALHESKETKKSLSVVITDDEFHTFDLMEIWQYWLDAKLTLNFKIKKKTIGRSLIVSFLKKNEKVS